MIDYREALKARGVVPNSTWMHDGGAVMYVVLPEDDASVQELIESLGGTGQFDNSEDNSKAEIGWMRVAKIRLAGKDFAGVDIVFVPLFLGQIDKGIFTRIG